MLVVGLGNPGARYEQTRHNVGFLVVDRLCSRWGISPTGRAQLGAQVSDGQLASHRAWLARPQGFMNRSGHPVASLMGYYKLTAEKVLVIHDDMGLPAGVVRCRQGGGHGGHNGLRDIIQHIGADFCRVRIGIDRPPRGWDPADYVLGKWSDTEQGWLSAALDTAADAVEACVARGIILAMNHFNTREGTAPADVTPPQQSPSLRGQEQ